MGWLKLWWRQSDHYDLLHSHLQDRGAADLTRVTIALITGGLAIVAPATIWTPAGPRNGLQLACILASCGGAAVAGLAWSRSWPTREMAVRCAVLSSTCIALLILGMSDPTVAELSCSVFAALASYIALFHTARLMVYNMLAALIVGGFEAIKVAESRTVVGALCAYSIVLLLNVVAPCGIQMVVHALGSDAARSERDQLTGLLTRRAFYRRARARLRKGAEELGYVVVAVMDLDRFKQVNDSHGHAAGDDALVAVARALCESNDVDAVIARSGGEEFVIVDIWQPDEVHRRTCQLCDIIAALPFDLTASIGTAGIHPAQASSESGALLVELIAAADAAMYAAKRRGGNQTCHHEWPLPPPLGSFADDGTGYTGGISA